MKWIAGILLLVFIGTALLQILNPPAPTPIGPTPLPEITIPKLNSDTAYFFTDKIVAFGPRIVGSPTAARVKAWIIDQFKKYGADVIEQPFKAKIYNGKIFDATNIIARTNLNATNRIVLSAHWDSRPFADSDSTRKNEPILGADDSGSAVGLLIEIARQLQKGPLSNLGVDIVLFDAEDYGSNDDQTRLSWALGSQYWAAHTHVAGYKPKYGINLDMIGARNARFSKERHSLNFAPSVVEKVWRVGRNLGYTQLFVDEIGEEITDDHYFVNTIAKIPMIDIINESSFSTYHHRHSDNMRIIDKETLKMTGQTLLHLLHYENVNAFDR